MGLNKNFYIREDYVVRENNNLLDTSTRSDEYQNDVYLFAKKIKDRDKVKNVADVGCGSAYKLKKYFSDVNHVGYELDFTVKQLEAKYPKDKWIVSDFNSEPEKAEMVICADVIEHVTNPDELLDFISKMNPKHIIISTPDRNLLVNKLKRSAVGPPANKYHVREWTKQEFAKYIGSYFKILQHINIEHEYGQLVYCKMK